MAGAANDDPVPFSCVLIRGLMTAVPRRCCTEDGGEVVIDGPVVDVALVGTATGPVVGVVVEATGADVDVVDDDVVASAPAGRIVPSESATTSTAVNRANDRRAPQTKPSLGTGRELMFMVLVPPVGEVGDALRSWTFAGHRGRFSGLGR